MLFPEASFRDIVSFETPPFSSIDNWSTLRCAIGSAWANTLAELRKKHKIKNDKYFFICISTIYKYKDLV